MRILFIIILLWAETVLAQNLFQTPSSVFEGQADVILPEESSVLRKRGLEINTSEIFKSLNKKEPLVLNLFPDVEMKAVIKESRTLDGGGSFNSGKLEDGGFMTMYISKEGIIRGEVHSARGAYTIRSNQKNKHQVIIRELDRSQIPRGDDVRTIDPELLKNFSRESFKKNFQLRESLQKSQTLPENQTVDILVLYTSRAREKEGGTAEVKATIEAEVRKTNQAIRKSGLSNREINLVAVKEVNYTQHSSGMGIDLNRLQFTEHFTYQDNTKPDPTGFMDEVHQWRDQYGADLVHLFVKDVTSGTCGLSYIYDLMLEEDRRQWCEDNYSDQIQECRSVARIVNWRAFKSFSVSAINERCSVTYTFTHELGHSMGLYHDRYIANSNNNPLNYNGPEIDQIRFPYKPYAFGYVNQNFNRRVCWHTIMAYPHQCIDEGGSPSIVQYFSTPSLHIGDEQVGYDPAGVSGSQQTTSLTGPADASRAINDTWDDTLIHLQSSSDSCQNTVFANPGNSINLEQPLVMSVSGGVESFRLFDIPEYCDTLTATVTSGGDFISVSTEKITNSDDSIDFQVDITLDRISGDSECSVRQGSITLRGDAGAEKTISIVQGTQKNLESVQHLICERAGSELLTVLRR